MLLLSSLTLAAEPCDSPSIHIDKSDAILELRCASHTERFVAGFGANPVGHKQMRGDERTPEGTYSIVSRVRSDRFDRFLGLSYPNAADRAAAAAAGRDPGDGIGIHGVPAHLAAPAQAWLRLAQATGLATIGGFTDGCIALANDDVERLYDVVHIGTTVTIVP